MQIIRIMAIFVEGEIQNADAVNRRKFKFPEIPALCLFAYRKSRIKNAALFEEILFCFLEFNDETFAILARASNVENSFAVELGSASRLVFGVFEIADAVLLWQ